VRRTPLLATATVLACGVLAPAGIAAAADAPTPSATSTPATPTHAGPTPATQTPATPTPATPTPATPTPATPTPETPTPETPTPGVADAVDPPANQAPVAVDDRAVSVVAGRSVVLDVLRNDTDDGLGRPVGEPPHLEVAAFGSLDGRVATDATRSRLTFTSRTTDARRSFTLSYTAGDGELT
jgi:hypothetical protein